MLAIDRNFIAMCVFLKGEKIVNHFLNLKIKLKSLHNKN